MKSLQKIETMVLLLSLTTVNLLALSAPTNFTAVNVTNSTISFSWTDNSGDEDGYAVCVKPQSGTPTECSDPLPPNTQKYIWTGRSPNTSKRYIAVAVKSPDTILESNSVVVKTTHTWDGELQKCINEDLGYGSDNTTHRPTKSELEGFRGDFNCALRELDSMDPVVDLKNITSLDLHENNIIGTIPAELGQLEDLTSLNLRNNQLNGTIPVELGQLEYLKYLYLNSNELNGSIPVELGELNNLETLSLNSNQLTGSIPNEIGQLIKLHYIHMEGNQLTGTIPAEIGQLKLLTTLLLGNNQLTGTIPTEIGELTELRYFRIYYNQLSGEIPESIVNLEDIDTPNDFSFRLDSNCNLFSNNETTKDYINIYHPSYTSNSGYNFILDTNSHDCSNTSTLVPVIMYLLN